MVLKKKSTPGLEAIRKKLYSAVLCDALDALGFPNQGCRTQLRPLTGLPRLVGRCRTTLWAEMAHEDPRPYELELRAVDGCRPGDVLVAAAGGSLRSAIWGELLTTAARNAGCIGALVDGAVRDVARMRAMRFPVFAAGCVPYDSKHRQRAIDMDTRVEVGGVEIRSGDLLLADEDGIVVVPQAVEEEALRRAWEKVHAENRSRDAIRAGMKASAAWNAYGVL